MNHQRLATTLALLICAGSLWACAGASETPKTSSGTTASPEALAKRCETNDASACHHLAYLNLQGKLVPENPERWFELTNKACDLKRDIACFDLAAFHAELWNRATNDPDGHADLDIDMVKQDAETYVQQACDQGNACACIALKTGDCNDTNACLVSGPDGCLSTCAEDPSCSSEAFWFLGK